eukprot:TRINITY_DN2435_c0_g1_i4.p1 TRINITY_DN2435_c0_g1~~TRINITY_DN2435_c0_g1_i4.p1  ORF type:complete len:137 (-),score=29.92 TRINITY_DN2435_c0_g1_i4:844-1254(-)
MLIRLTLIRKWQNGYFSDKKSLKWNSPSSLKCISAFLNHDTSLNLAFWAALDLNNKPLLDLEKKPIQGLESWSKCSSLVQFKSVHGHRGQSPFCGKVPSKKAKEDPNGCVRHGANKRIAMMATLFNQRFSGKILKS